MRALPFLLLLLLLVGCAPTVEAPRVLVDIRPAAPPSRSRPHVVRSRVPTAPTPSPWRRQDVVDEVQRLARATTTRWARGSAPCASSDAPWRCLDVERPEVAPFAFTYRLGTDYVGPAFGGIDPGPDGLEIAARADRGDATCVFAMTATLDPATGPRWFTQIFASEACPPRGASQ